MGNTLRTKEPLDELEASEAERKRAEEALRESEEEKTTLIEEAPVAICHTDLKGTIKYVNRRFEGESGYSREEIIGKNGFKMNFFSNATLRYFRQRMIARLKGKPPKQWETQFKCKDGRWIWVAIEGRVIKKFGVPVGFQILASNITERKKREQLQHDENYVLTLLGQGAELSELLDAIVRLGEGHDPSIKGSVLLFDPSRELLLQASAPSLPDDFKELLKDGLPIGPNVGSCGTAAYLKERVIVTDIENSPLFKPYEEDVKRIIKNGLLACWSQPIISSNGDLLGTIANYSNKVGEPDADNLRVLEWSARIAAIAIEGKRAEKAQQESEEKFSKAFLASPEAIAIIRLKDNTFIEVNESFTRFTGYTHEEVINRDADELDLWVYEEERARMLQIVQEQGRVYREEFHSRMKSGQIRTGLFSGELISIQGEPCMTFVITDITELMRAEEALRESEEKFSKAFRSSPNTMVITTVKDGKFIEINDSHTRITGYTREETIGHTAVELGLWAKPQDRTRMIQMLKEQGRVDNEEFDFRMKSGEIRTWLFSAEPINIGGEPCIISMTIDITELRRAEEALRESEEKFSKAFRSSPDSISITTLKDGKFLEVNDSFTRITGYSHEELIGRSSVELGLWVKVEDRARMVQIAKEQGRVENEEFNIRMKSGETRIWLFSAELINIGSEPCIISVTTDITERKAAEEALRESEEKFSKAFRSSPVSISITTLKDGIFIEANDNFTRFTGYTHDEVIGHSSTDINIWAKADDRDRMLRMLKERGRVINEEFDFRVKSGEIRNWLFSAEVINIGGEPCIIVMTVDITERKAAEEALRESEEKFSKAFRSSPLAISINTLEDDTIIESNESARRISGYTREELIGRCAADLNMWVKAEERDRVLEKLREQGRVQNEEVHLRKKSGEIQIVQFSAERISIGDKQCILSVINDITEIKQMEAALRESEEKFYKAFSASPDIISIVKIEDNKFIEVNDSFVRFTGYAHEEIIGRTATELGIWAKAEERDRVLKKLREQGRVSNEEVHICTKSGDIRIALLSSEIINIGGEPCSIAVVLDITERKAAEEKLKQTLSELEHSSAQLAATNQELEAFSYSVSHDLRAPLRSIDGFSQALLEDYLNKLDEGGQDYLRRLRGASQKMGELIDGLLKLSRLTRSEMHQEKVDLSALAREITTRLQETQPERQVEVVIDRGLTANGDRQLLRALLENLLGNAWKFTGQCPQARIEFGATQNGDKKAFFVRDNGAGFDMTYADKLFGAFQRLHKTTEFPGTGIGLATVRRITHRHGGSVWAEGAVGKGATFYFTLN